MDLSEWVLGRGDMICFGDGCTHRFKDGETVYVSCWSLPDGYPGDCDVYCEKHREDYYTEYIARIIVGSKQ